MQAFVHTASLKVRGKTRLALAAAFLFFVLYSALHRVHHLFEELGVSPKSSDDAATPTTHMITLLNIQRITTPAMSTIIAPAVPPKLTAWRKPSLRISFSRWHRQ